MAPVFSNNATSLLAVAINTSVTTVVVQTGDAAKFPAPTGGDWFPITVIDGLGNMEIMRCTARSGANLTVVRGQEGTTAQSFSIGARVDLRLTAAVLAAFLPSASYTAADVLAKLLTVDGTGSGLDADALDGQSAAYYLDLANATGTLPDARLPDRLRAFPYLIADWNTATENGWFMGSGASNAPAALTGWAIGEVFAHNSAWITQEVFDFTSVTAANGLRYRRHRLSGTWGPWYKVTDSQAELDARYLLLAGGTITGGIVNNSPMSTRGFGMYWADMSSNINEGSAIFGNNLYASFNGSTTDYKTTFTGSVGYAALRLAGGGIQAARATGATTAGAIVTPTWHDVLDKGNYKGARSLGLSQANFTIGAANYDSPWVGYNSNHTLTLPSSATAGISAVLGPFKAFDGIALTIQRAGSDTIRINETGSSVTSLVLSQGQQVTLVSDGAGTWYAFGLNHEVLLLETGAFSNVATVDIVLPPGFRQFRIEGRNVSTPSGSAQFYSRLRTQSSGVWRSGGTDYRDARLNVTGGSTSGGGFSNSTSQMWLAASVHQIGHNFTLDLYDARDAAKYTAHKAFFVGDQFGVGWDCRVATGRNNVAEDNDAIRFFMAAGNMNADNFRLIGIP